MPRNHEILILQKSKALPANLREQLRENGYTARTVFLAEKLKEEIADCRAPIILIDSSDSKQVSAKIVQQLVDLADVCDYPLLFISKSPENFKDAFSKYFIQVLALEAPVETDQVLAAVGTISEEYDQYLTKLKKISPDKYEKLTGTTQAVRTVVPVKPLHVHPDYESPELITEMLVDGYEKFVQKKIYLGGDLYTSGLNEQTLIDNQCFPGDPEEAAIAREICGNFKAPEKAHIYRTAFLTGKTAGPVDISLEKKNLAAFSSFLFASTFSEARRELMRQNYLKPGSRSLRRNIGDQINRGLDALDYPVSDDAIDIIIKTSLLIGEGKIDSEPDENSTVASIIIASDLTGRICFHSGFWDAFAARSMLRAIKHGQLAEIQPDIMCCILKFLSETICSQKPGRNVSFEDRYDPKLQAAAVAAENREAGRHEKRIKLHELEAGMRLAHPLLSYDGKEVLSADMILDHDLIWRVWQLASIRPLNTPVIIED